MLLNFDHNSNLSRKKVSHYTKIVKMCQFYSDCSRFFFLQPTVPECSPHKNLANENTLFFKIGPIKLG
jgi:hypothetical protein